MHVNITRHRACCSIRKVYGNLYPNRKPERLETLRIRSISDKRFLACMSKPLYTSPALIEAPTPGISLEHPVGKATVCPYPCPWSVKPCPGLCQIRSMVLPAACWEGPDALCAEKSHGFSGLEGSLRDPAASCPFCLSREMKISESG